MNPPPREQSTALLAQLKRQMTRVGELPGFADTIRRIVDAMRAEEKGARERDMTDTVLQDVTLTQKVMRLANSPMYAMFGDSVDSVSRALYVLGTDAVGHLALGLTVLEQMDSSCPESGSARQEMERSRTASEIARQLTALVHPQSAERAAVCSILHGLGRLLLSYYLPQEWARVQALMSAESLDEAQAARRCLGLTPTEVGRHVAQDWGLPASITAVLRDVEPMQDADSDELSHDEWLAAMASYAGRCAQIVQAAPADEAHTLAPLQALSEEFSQCLKLPAEALFVTAQRVQAQARVAAAASKEVAPVEAAPAQLSVIDAKACEPLQQALGDISLLVGHANLGQLFQHTLDALQQAMGFQRATLFLRNTREQRFIARFFAGENTAALRTLTFADKPTQDTLGLILGSRRPTLISMSHIGRSLPHLPRWMDALTDRTPGFFALPVFAGKAPVALIYADWGRRRELPSICDEGFQLAGRLAQELERAVLQASPAAQTKPMRVPAAASVPLAVAG